MPYYVNLNLAASFNLENGVPVNLEPPEGNALNVSYFVFFKGADGGNLGQQSDLRKYLGLGADVVVGGEGNNYFNNVYNNDNLELLNESAVYQNDANYINGQNAGGYAIKHITKEKIISNQVETINDMTGKLVIRYIPDDERNIYTGYNETIIDSSTTVINNGMPFKEIENLKVYPHESLKYDCQLYFDTSLNKWMVTGLQDSDENLVDMGFLNIGDNLFISGTDGYVSSCIMSGDENYYEKVTGGFYIPSVYGDPLTEIDSSYNNTYKSGAIFVLGNNGSIDDYPFYSSTGSVVGADPFISFDSSVSGFSYFLNMPRQSYFKIPMTGIPLGQKIYRNTVNFYVVELDYDDRDRKMDPVLMNDDLPDGKKPLYYNINSTGCLDPSYDFYYNYLTESYVNYDSPNKTTSINYPLARLPIGMNVNADWYYEDRTRLSEANICMSFTSSSDITNVVDISGEIRTSLGVIEDTQYDYYRPLTISIQRKSSRNPDKDFNYFSNSYSYNSSFLPTETSNTLKFIQDGLGLQASDLEYEKVNVFSEDTYDKMKNSVFERGGGKYWITNAYDSVNKSKVRDKNKFMIIHHGYNARTNTYFWGYNGVFNKQVDATNKQYTKIVKTSSGVASYFYNYIGNFCSKNNFTDINYILNGDGDNNRQLAYSDSRFAKRYVDVIAEKDTYNAIKMNLYQSICYMDVGDDPTSDQAVSDFISKVYFNLKKEYSNKTIFGGSAIPRTNSELLAYSATEQFLYYDVDTVKSPIYGRVGAKMRVNNQDNNTESETGS